MSISTDDYRRLMDERHEVMLAAVRDVRASVDLVGAGINRRLDTLNGQVAKHEDRLSALERRDAFEDGHQHALEGRLQPNREERKQGDEEMSIRVTPRMWAALVTVGGVLYTVLHFIFAWVKER